MKGMRMSKVESKYKNPDRFIEKLKDVIAEQTEALTRSVIRESKIQSDLMGEKIVGCESGPKRRECKIE